MSTLVSKNVQVGTSGTATDNFTIFQPATPDGTLRIGNGNTGITTSLLTLTSAGNLGVGVAPSAWGSAYKAVQIGITGQTVYTGNSLFSVNNAFNNGTNWIYQQNSGSAVYEINRSLSSHIWYTAPSGTAGNAISFTQAMTLDASGNLLVGTTSAQVYGVDFRNRIVTAGTFAQQIQGTGSSAVQWIHATNTTGDPGFIQFVTDASNTRGSITYNRGAGVVAYNTTSDYRAKDITGPVTDSGAVIDSTPVYMGKMKGATQERPMFIAHEVPAYAHTGEKDAVDADGKPVYQQMDASALVPVMWAEIQSLRQRLAAAGI